MSAGRREVLGAAAWAVPAIAVGSPAPKTAASCDLEFKILKVTRCGKSFTVVIRTYTQKPRTITLIPGNQWKVEPENINVPGGYADTGVVITPGKGKIFTLAWTAATGCAASGCVTIDVRGVK